MQNQNYTFHYRGSEFSVLLTDIIFHPSVYGRFDCRVLQYKDVASAWLTARGAREASRYGMKLMNKNFAKRYFEAVKNFDALLQNKYAAKSLKNNLSASNWHELENLLRRFMWFYNFMDHPFFVGLENIVLAECSKPDDLVKLLHNPKLAREFKLSPRATHALNVIVELGKYKLRLHEHSTPWLNVMHAFVKNVARRYNIAHNQALALRAEEFNKAMAGHKIPNINLLNERIKGSVFIPTENRKALNCLTGKHYHYWQRKLEMSNKNDIAGTPTYPGIVRGPVKIHLAWTSTIDIPKNCVLVTGMTNPQIVPMLKNAAAIVTDEGGLTCHAAIISRELKIPCIVGTTNATQILKDGDIVEVDANNGVVKKIN